MERCKEKERLDKIEKTVIQHDRLLISLEGDVKHIRERLDNGISTTLNKVLDEIRCYQKAVSANTFNIGNLNKAYDEYKPIIEQVKLNTQVCEPIRKAKNIIFVIGLVSIAVVVTLLLGNG